MSDEPLIHSHITDELPEGHPLAFSCVHCKKCGVLVHDAINECMQTWVETGNGNFCLMCLAKLTDGVLDEEYALTPKGGDGE